MKTSANVVWDPDVLHNFKRLCSFQTRKDPGNNNKLLQTWSAGRWEGKTRKGSKCVLYFFFPFSPLFPLFFFFVPPYSSPLLGIGQLTPLKAKRWTKRDFDPAPWCWSCCYDHLLPRPKTSSLIRCLSRIFRVLFKKGLLKHFLIFLILQLCQLLPKPRQSPGTFKSQPIFPLPEATVKPVSLWSSHSGSPRIT